MISLIMMELIGWIES